MTLVPELTFVPRGPTILGDGFSVKFELEDLHQGRACILEHETGESLIFLAKFLPTHIKDGFSDYAFAIYCIENQIRREANEPSKFGSFAKTIENTWTWDGYPEDSYLPENHPIIGIGLVWVEQARSKVGGEWRLTIGGYPDLCLGYAKWDDEAGVRALVKYMNDAESLPVMIALTYPNVSHSIVRQRPYTKPMITDEMIIEITEQNELINQALLHSLAG
jgi:hypothetical protein